jgi:integrase
MTKRKETEGTAKKVSAKRTYGEGSVSQRKDGRYQGDYPCKDGKRRTLYAKTEKEAWQKIRQAQAKDERGELVASNRITLTQFLEEWLSLKKLTDRAKTFRDRKLTIKNHINPALGAIRVQQLSSRHIQKWVAGISEELAPSTVKNYFSVLRAALEHAIKMEIIKSNPCGVIALPKVIRNEHAILSPDEIDVLLKHLQGKYLHDIVIMGLATAMRISEIIALQWADVDWDNPAVIIRHNVVFIPREGFIEGPPKTESSIRRIALPDFCLAMLKEHHVEQLRQRFKSGAKWQNRDLVFSNKFGGFRFYGGVWRDLKTALLKCGLCHIGTHGLRHTAVTLLIAAGVPIKAIQEILGHKSISMTLDIYGHLLDGVHKDSMVQMHQLFVEKIMKRKKA